MSSAPSYVSVYIHAIAFCFTTAFPRFCTNKTRSLAVAALAPCFIYLLTLPLQRRSVIDNPLLYYTILSLVILLSVVVILFLILMGIMAGTQLSHRKEANPSAVLIVEQGLKDQRIIRQDQLYDVYLPPPHGDKKKKNFPIGFFMLPGALLEHNVYAPILTQIAEAGILVVIQNCEPIRVASEGLGSGERDVMNIIADLRERHGICAEQWSIGGHSMGGYTATMIAKRSNFFHSLVLYGVNQSYQIEKTSIRALALTASNDGFLRSRSADISSFDEWGDSTDSTAKLQYVMIQGGNHTGFGDYPLQTYPLRDGERTITLEEQHRQVAEATIKFLLPKHD